MLTHIIVHGIDRQQWYLPPRRNCFIGKDQPHPIDQAFPKTRRTFVRNAGHGKNSIGHRADAVVRNKMCGCQTNTRIAVRTGDAVPSLLASDIPFPVQVYKKNAAYDRNSQC